MEFNYYYGTEADQYSFIRIPKLLLTGEYFSGLSLPAKVLYGLLLDRMGLSIKNRWLDEDNKVYIIYQIADIQSDLGYSKKKSMDFLNELEQIGLVEKKKRGFGLPSILYVKNFISNEMVNTRDAENDTTNKMVNTRGVENDITNEMVSSRGAENDTSDKMVSYRGAENDTSVNIDNEDIIEAEDMDFAKNAFMFSEKSPENQRSVKIDSSRGAENDTSRGAENDTSRSAENDTSRSVDFYTPEVPVWEPLNNNTKYNNTKLSDTESYLIKSREDEKEIWRGYASLVRSNLELDILKERHPYDGDILDGIYDLILEVLVSKNDHIVISGDRYPAELVKSKMLRLKASHIEYILNCLASSTSQVRNIKKYMLAALFNAPTTMKGYYQAAVHHDMAQQANDR